jgi:hypothetical protein
LDNNPAICCFFSKLFLENLQSAFHVAQGFSPGSDCKVDRLFINRNTVSRLRYDACLSCAGARRYPRSLALSSVLSGAHPVGGRICICSTSDAPVVVVAAALCPHFISLLEALSCAWFLGLQANAIELEPIEWVC